MPRRRRRRLPCPSRRPQSATALPAPSAAAGLRLPGRAPCAARRSTWRRRPPSPSTRRSSGVWPRRWRSSRPTGCTGTSPPGSTLWAPSRWATRPSTSRASCRRSPRAPGPDPGFAAPPLRRGRNAARGAAAPPGRLYGLDRLRDRAHLRPRRARLARQAIESGRFRQPLDDEERRSLLRRLSQAEGFEQYLRRSFLGQKQFSLEGLESLVPMLDETISWRPPGARTRS